MSNILTKQFYSLSRLIAHSIYPWNCAICGIYSTDKGVCKACESYLPWCWKDKKCDVCGLPISSNLHHILICGQCQKRPPYFDHLVAVFWYQSPINQLITQYKYFYHWEHIHTLVTLANDEFKNACEDALLIPVPSHASRVRQRGFNAVYELVKLLSKQYAFDYDSHLVKRIKKTELQTGKTKTQRQQNVRHAFEVTDMTKVARIQHAIIIDEVVTTGATVNEISRCLKKAGVSKVTVWALARTKVNLYR